MKQMGLDVRRIDLVELLKLNEMCDKLDPVQLARMASREALKNLDQVRMISVQDQICAGSNSWSNWAGTLDRAVLVEGARQAPGTCRS